MSAGAAAGPTPRSLLLAFAELRLLLAWRRLRGRSGVPELVARVLIWLIVLPLGLVFAAATGAAAYRGVRAGGGLSAELAVRGLFFGVFAAWTSMAMTVTDRDAVDLRRFLAYPIAPWRLTAYGLGASVAGDPFSVFWVLMLTGAFLGAAVARPGAWLLLLLLAIALFVLFTVAVIAALQAFASRFLAGRRHKLLGIAAIYAATMGLAAWGTSGQRQVWEVFRLFGWVRWVAVPAVLAEKVVTPLYRGEAAPSLPWLAALAFAAAATTWAAHRLALSAALSGGGSGADGAAVGAGWRLPGRLGGLLEKEGKYLLRNPLSGLLLLLIPMLAALVSWKVAPKLAAQDSGEVLRVLPLVAFALYAHLVTEVFYLNAFGWERGGGRVWFLAPLAPADVLLAKNAVAYAFSLVLFALCAGATLAFGGAPPGWGLAAAFALHAGAAPWLAGAGNFVSVLNPRAIPYDIQRGGSLSPLSALAGVLVMSGVSAIFGLPALLAIRLESPAVLVGAWAAVGIGGAVAYRLALPRAARLLEARREPLLEAVAGDDLQ
ncbi:MAG: hypothetical protein U0229_02720 [Anaeromyxobacter sp.]